MSIKNNALKNNSLTKFFKHFFGQSVSNVYLSVTCEDDFNFDLFKKHNEDLEKQFSKLEPCMSIDIGYQCIIEFVDGKMVEVQFADQCYPMMFSIVSRSEIEFL